MTQAYHRDSRIAKTLTIAAFSLALALRTLATTKKGPPQIGTNRCPGLPQTWKISGGDTELLVRAGCPMALISTHSMVCLEWGARVQQGPLMPEQSSSCGQNLLSVLCRNQAIQFANNFLYVLGLNDGKLRVGSRWFDHTSVSKVLTEE